MKKMMALFAFLFISGCSTHYSGSSPELNKENMVYLMPFTNQSNMPMAQAQAEQLVASALAEQGLSVRIYPKRQVNDLQASLEPTERDIEAVQWLEKQQPGYIISGSVQEWQYKFGLDSEPVIGLTLTLSDTEKNEVWRGSISKSGWGRESLSHTALKAIDDLLNELDWN